MLTKSIPNATQIVLKSSPSEIRDQRTTNPPNPPNTIGGPC